MGMAALQKSAGADFFETWGRRVDSVLCPFFLFCFVVFKGKGFFNSSLLKSPCYQENHTTVPNQSHKK